MPHIVVLYTSNLEADADVGGLCRVLADTLLAQRDEAGEVVFPVGGTRGRALDGDEDYGFVYLNLRMGTGRSDAVKKAAGDALSAAARRHLAPLLERRHVGITLQVDEAPGQVYDAKLGNLHDLFRK